MLTLATSASAPPARAAVTRPVGISPGADLLWLSSSDLAAELDLYKATGMTWLRVDFDWPSIESTKGSFNWSSTDRVINAANARGLKVLALPTYSPTWATTVSGNSHAGPKNPADYANFVTKAVTRYAPLGVKAWEIWNEPNLSNFWAPKPDPAAYAALVKAAYPAIKAVDPTATVLAGALSPATDPADGSQVSPVVFTTKMYANGAAGYFDALSVHPYCYPAMPDDTSTSSWNTFQRLPLVHDVMAAHGDNAKQIWLTEYGAPTGTDTGAVSEATQATLLTAGITAADSWPWTGPLFFYGGRDRGTNPGDREQNFGFVRYNFTPKAARNALTQALTADPDPTPTPTPTPTPSQTATPAPTPSQTPSGTTPVATPATPTDVSVSSVTGTTATVRWTVADQDAVTGYQLRIRRNSGSWKTLARVTSTSGSATLTGLSRGSRYTVQVSVFNDAGRSPYSASVSFRTATATTASAVNPYLQIVNRLRGAARDMRRGR